MDHEPNQPQSSSYGQEPPPYGQQQYREPPPHAQPYYDQQHYDQPQLQYVSVWPRAAATIIDCFLLVVIIDFLIIIFIPTHDNAPNASIPLFFIAFFGSILVFFGYFIVMEAMWGATLGKMMLGLRVVKTDGSPLGWSQAVIRNLLRVIDGLFSYLVGAILIWDSPLRQRLGDRAAKTVVVRRTQTVERFSFGKVLIHTGILQLVLTLVGFVIRFLFGVTGNADNIGGYIATLFLIGTITAIIGFTIIGRRVPKAFRWKHLTYVAIGIVVTTWILYAIFLQTLIPDLSVVVTLIQTFVSMGIGGWIANAMK